MPEWRLVDGKWISSSPDGQEDAADSLGIETLDVESVEEEGEGVGEEVDLPHRTSLQDRIKLFEQAQTPLPPQPVHHHPQAPPPSLSQPDTSATPQPAETKTVSKPRPSRNPPPPRPSRPPVSAAPHSVHPPSLPSSSSSSSSQPIVRVAHPPPPTVCTPTESSNSSVTNGKPESPSRPPPNRNAQKTRRSLPQTPQRAPPQREKEGKSRPSSESEASLLSMKHSSINPQPSHPMRQSHQQSTAPMTPIASSIPPPPPPPKPPAAQFVARWSFVPRHPDELELALGDVIEELRGERLRTERDWMMARNCSTGQVGLCPVNYLAPQSASDFNSVGLAPQQEPKQPGQDVQHHVHHPIGHTRSLDETRKARSEFPMDVLNRKKAGYATDVIGIRSKVDNKVFATNFNVRFTGKSAKSQCRGNPVHVIIGGKVRFEMILQEGGTCTFPNGNFQCDPLVLGSIKGVSDVLGPHRLRFEHKYQSNGEYRIAYIDAFLWIWEVSDSFLVSDIDGTITKTDVGGMINGVLGARMGWKKGHAHDGVCNLYNELIAHMGAKILYLTARPLNLINETRSYIYELEQNAGRLKKRLPDGAIITDTTNYTSSFRREVLDKSSHIFKIQMLQQLRECFRNAGRDIRRFPVFLAGFGNKETDLKAYLAAGVPSATIFVIDSNSLIQGTDSGQRRMSTYDDSHLLRLLLERMRLIKDGFLPDPNLPIES